jgi:hypothetical protein
VQRGYRGAWQGMLDGQVRAAAGQGRAGQLLGSCWAAAGQLQLLGSCWAAAAAGQLLGSCWAAAGQLLGSCSCRAGQGRAGQGRLDGRHDGW